MTDTSKDNGGNGRTDSEPADGFRLSRRTAAKGAAGVAAFGVGILGSGTADAAEDYDGSDGNRAIGGGEEYNRKIPPSKADYMISEVERLRPVLEDEAESGDIVYIDPDVTLVPTDLGYDYADNIPVPEGVTLASNRGIDGAPGGHVHVDLARDDEQVWPVFDIEADVRVTGLRLSGPDWDWYDGDQVGMGIRALGPGTAVDNCELWGFVHAAVRKGHPMFYGNFSINVHNNYIHHNPRDGLGYGVASSYAAHDLIEYNLFENNRHSIAGGGSGGYTARFNHAVGEYVLGHHFDMHRPGGTRIHIHHNTLEAWKNPWEEIGGEPRPEQGVSIRGVPEDEAWIHHNWFHNPLEPLPSEEMDENEWTDEAITQVHVNEWQNVRFDHNHYGSDEPDRADIGAPTSE